jgi:hypothetical protein
MLFWGCTLNELVSASIEQEDACRAHFEERNKRPLPEPNGGAPLDLHSAFRPATWFPFVTAVEPPFTSAGGPMSSSVPAAGCTTLSIAVGWGRIFVL